VNEYVCFSIWRNGGADLRYSRLKDTVIAIPPLQTDMKFYTSHSSDSVYYIGTQKDGEDLKTVLVVIYLKNLEHKVYDLSKLRSKLDASYPIKDLEDSSLIMNDTHFVIKSFKTVQGKHHAKEQKYFVVYNLEEDKEIWTINDCEKVFFPAPDLDDEIIEFENEPKSKKQDEDDDSQNSRREPEKPDKVHVIQRKTEVRDVDDDDEDDKKDDKKDDKEAKGED
jgi:hypothetical protein